MRPRAFLITYIGVPLLLAVGCSDSSSPPAPPVPIAITVASQNNALFVSWYSADSSSHRSFFLEGKNSSGRTVSRQCPSHGGCLLTGLENDVLWQVSLAEITSARLSGVGHSAGTPRARSQYAYFDYASSFLQHFHIFTSWDAADSWLRTNGIQVDELRYRGQKIGAWDQDVRNGFYSYGEFSQNAFLLSRDLDSQFNMDQSLEDPQEVMRLFRRIVGQANAEPLNVSAPYVEYELNARYNIVTDSPTTQGCPVIKAKLKSSVDDPRSTIAHLIQCTRPLKRGLAIYLEGHSGSGLEQSTDTWAYLANLGWDILLIDMPMSGFNYLDSVPAYHYAYAANDSGTGFPIAEFLDPIKWGVDWALSRLNSPPARLITIGRSGGGWASVLYSSIDTRIEYAVVIAGLIPASMRLEKTSLSDVGDYEQMEPGLFSYVPYERLMISTGSKGAFYIYNENDPCCFQVNANNPLLTFLQNSARTFNREIGFYIDPDNTEHSASLKALEAMRVFINDLPL